MNRFLLLFIFLLGSFSALFSQDKKYDKSVSLLEEGKVKKAMAEIDNAIKINGDSSKYYMLKADIDYAINKDINSFFILLNKSIDVEPENPRPVMNRGYFYDMVNQHNNAILDYNDALKLAKKDSVIQQILVSRGTIYWSIRKHELAKKDLLKAYELDSNDVYAMNNLALCIDDLGEAEESRRILIRMVAVDSTFFPAWMNLGFYASSHENYEESLFYLDKALFFTDENHESYNILINNRGYSKMKLGDIQGAMKDIKKSIKLDPSNSYAYRNLALVYIEKKEMVSACENLVLAKRNGYTKYYGDDVDELLKEHCGN